MKILNSIVLTAAITTAACGGGSDSDTDAASGLDGAPTADGGDRPQAAADRTRDIVSTGIELDLAAERGTATLELVPSETSTGLTLERGDLSITSVTGAGGGALNYDLEGDEVNIGLPFNATQVVIAYQFADHAAFDGWDPAAGLSFLWPTFCGNLFPCHSDPADGSTFTLAVTGLPDGATAVYPTSIPSEAPSYMPAIAVGVFTDVDLGTTTAGTAVHAWHLPGQEAATTTGTAHLRDVVDFYERTYGAYSFGDTVGSVSASWGPGAYGGMEHHPFWHVATDAMSDEETHAHEAAHGWFGDAVRLRCWEDFVLSEGTVTYLAARALGAVAGSAKEHQIWASYQERLDALPRNSKAAWPTGCGKVDILRDGLFSEVPYMRGAFFYKAVAEAIGVVELDGVLARFYLEHQGRAAGMQDMLDAIQHDTGFDPRALVEKWLR